MIALVDNYDSFSYNLYQMIGSLYPHIQVIRNDEVSVDKLLAAHPEAIVLSPGPGRPTEAGVCKELSLRAGDIPVMGVCLGHQALCEAAGATIVHAKRLVHGKQSSIRTLNDCPLFAGLPNTFPVGRYHSLSVDANTLPVEFKVTAVSTDDNEVMAVQHASRPLFGLQFHPESILTPQGKTIMENFLTIVQVE